MVEKYVRDGKVAIIISPCDRGGWASLAASNEEAEFLLFDKELVSALIVGDTHCIERRLATRGVKLYLGWKTGLTLCWLPEGTQFRLRVRNGVESLEIHDPAQFYTA